MGRCHFCLGRRGGHVVDVLLVGLEYGGVFVFGGYPRAPLVLRAHNDRQTVVLLIDFDISLLMRRRACVA